MSILGNRVLRIEDPRLADRRRHATCADLRDAGLDGRGPRHLRALDRGARPGWSPVDVDAARAPARRRGRGHRRRRRPAARSRVCSTARWSGPPGARPGAVRRRAGGRRAHRAPRAGRGRGRVGGGRLRAAAGGGRPDRRRWPARWCCSPSSGTNLVREFGDERGADGPDGLDDCEVVVRQRIVNQRVAAARWRCGRRRRPGSTAGCMRVVLDAERPRRPRHALAATLRARRGATCAVVAPDVGGGFGAKIGGHPEDLLLRWLARRCGRPVRWIETRTENMAGHGAGPCAGAGRGDRRPARRHDRGLPPRRSCRTPAPTRPSAPSCRASPG